MNKILDVTNFDEIAKRAREKGSYVDKIMKEAGLPDEESFEKIDDSILLKKYPFTWGIPELDNEFKVIDYNRLIILAGEGGSGKTTFTLQQAIENANNGKKVCYMSLEMGRKQLIIQSAKKRAGIVSATKVNETIQVSANQKKIFNDELDRLQNNEYLNIKGYKNALSREMFVNELEILAQKYDMIFIDNLGMIGRGEKESELLPKIMEELMKARQEHNVTIVALHHMTKGDEKQSGPRGKNAIRGSGKVLDDADYIVTITRTEIGTLIGLKKDRENGNFTTATLTFDKGIFKADVFN